MESFLVGGAVVVSLPAERPLLDSAGGVTGAGLAVAADALDAALPPAVLGAADAAGEVDGAGLDVAADALDAALLLAFDGGAAAAVGGGDAAGAVAGFPAAEPPPLTLSLDAATVSADDGARCAAAPRSSFVGTPPGCAVRFSAGAPVAAEALPLLFASSAARCAAW